MYGQAAAPGTVISIFATGMIAIALLLAMQSAVPAQDALFVEHLSRDDFQDDGLGQWASYPPAQDIGYEPSLTPTRDFGAAGGRALMRWIQPTRAGDLRFGFIKKVDLVTNSEARIVFDYRINAPAEGARIDVGVAGVDGHRYTGSIEAVTNRWTKATVSLRSVTRRDGTSLTNGIGIEAVYLVARVPGAQKDSVYRFLIDNVEFAALRAASFDIVSPHSAAVQPWKAQIANRRYNPGETVKIEARTSVPLSRVSVTLADHAGSIAARAILYDDGTHGDSKAKDGTWTNGAVHKFAATDADGIWRADLRGEARDGRVVSTQLRFLVHSDDRRPHPLLYFDAKDKSKLVARTRDPNLAKVWEHIKTAAKNSRTTGDIGHGGKVFELLDSEYLLPSLLGYFDVLNRARTRIGYNAFVAYLTDDAEARNAAKDAMLAVSRWGRWEPPWFTAHGQHTYYPAGLLAVDVALGYDLLYDHLTEVERSQIRRALIEKQIIPTYREYFLDNRAMANTSNWISHTVGGALIAASAIAGDVTPEESDGKFNLYVNGLLMKIEAHMAASYLPDGSYGEGISYQEFDSETLAPMISAVERNFRVDYWNTTSVKDSLRYSLYTLTEPREASPDMGDTHPPAGHGISPLIYRSKDPVIRWYYSRLERPSLQQFIFYDDTVQPQSPDAAGIPTSTIFPDKGNAVFRSAWGEDSITLLFRAGPNFNHHHADQGSFLITAFGEPLVTEAGWSDYYKDPYYATFFTQAVGHNTVLVDGNPESQILPDTPQFAALNDYPRITDSVTSEFYDGVGSDLSSVYPERIERYTRRIVFLKPHYFVIYDDLKTRGEPAQFDLLLHLPNRAGIKTEGSTAIYNGTKAALGVRSFAPATDLSVKDGRIPYHIFSARTPPQTPFQPAYLDFKTKRANEMEFVTAVVPARTSGEASELLRKMFRLTGENLTGVRVERGDATDHVMFRAGAGNAPMRTSDWSADASALTVTTEGVNLNMFAAQNARSVTRGGRLIFSSEMPASIAVKYGEQQIDAVLNSRSATKIVLRVTNKPVRLLLDRKGMPTRAFRFDPAAGTIELNVPAGRHEIKTFLK